MGEVGFLTMSKSYFKVYTDVRPEYRWAYSARQALWLVWHEYKGYGCKTTWNQAVDGWEVSAVDS